MHPSFEDRPGAPDRVFASLAPEAGDHLVRAWTGILARAWAEPPSVLHLHHLTPHPRGGHGAVPGHAAGDPPARDRDPAARADRPPVRDRALARHRPGRDGRRAAGRLGGRRGPEPGRAAPDRRDALGVLGARRALVAAPARRGGEVGPRGRDLASPPRGGAQRCSHSRRSGCSRFPTASTCRVSSDCTCRPSERLARWRHWLVEAPQGWDESGTPGTIAYRDEDLRWFEPGPDGRHAPVLLFVGRFTEVKQLPMLIRAYARARERFARPAPLVIWGGFPGEWEGEHPCSVAREVGPEGIFFVGWRGHTDLPDGLACADVMVAPSAREGFGQMLVEAMACGLPVIATRSGGPTSFVNTEPGSPNGWLLDPDDRDGLAEALVEAVNDEQARREPRRGRLPAGAALALVGSGCRALRGLYEELLAGRQPADRGHRKLTAWLHDFYGKSAANCVLWRSWPQSQRGRCPGRSPRAFPRRSPSARSSRTVSARRCTWPPTTLRRPRSASWRWRGQSRCMIGVPARRWRTRWSAGSSSPPRVSRSESCGGAGIRRPSMPFTAPWDAIRSCVQVEGGEVRIARRCELPADPRGDLLQAGPLLVHAGAPVMLDGADPEGFSAASEQFDSDITAGRHPRAALGVGARCPGGGGLRRPRRGRCRAVARRARAS